MESLHIQRFDTPWDHEPNVATFCPIWDKRLYAQRPRFMGSLLSFGW